MNLEQRKILRREFEELDKELFRSMILHYFAKEDKSRMKRTRAHVRRWKRGK
jgi:hypothetical protein